MDASSYLQQERSKKTPKVKANQEESSLNPGRAQYAIRKKNVNPLPI